MNIINNLLELKLHDLLLGRLPSEYKERYYHERIKINHFRMFALSLYIIITQISLNIINMLKPVYTKTPYTNKFINLSLLTLFIGIVFLILSLVFKSGGIKSIRIRHLAPYTLLYTYVFMQMLFFLLSVHANIPAVNGYIIALFIMTFCFVTRPVHVFINLLASGGYFFIVMYVNRTEHDLWNSVVMTDTWAHLLIISALFLLISISIYNIYINNFLTKMEYERCINQAKKLANFDSLTCLLNRRGFFELLDASREDFINNNSHITFALMDVDFFKKYNDCYGHLAGDDCLLNISIALKKHFNKYDGNVCRFGGEEFLAFFHSNDSIEAHNIAEGARVAIEKLKIKFAIEESLNSVITISCGVTVPILPVFEHDKDMNDLINEADIALYEAKQAGRNKVITFHQM